jgi:hypothetical protein
MTFLKPLVAAGSALWLLFANTSLEAPRLGYVRLENREVWSIRGVAGSFYLGQFAAGDVEQQAFNGSAGIRTYTSTGQVDLLGSSGEILRQATLDGTKVRQAGLSYIEDAAFVRTSTELWRLDRERADRYIIPELIAIDVAAATHPDQPRIVAISGAGGYLELALASQGQISIRRLWLESGESVVRETFNGSPEHFVFLGHGMSLWTEDGLLVLRRADGSTVRIETDAQFTALHPVGRDLLQASAADGRQFAVQITGSPLHLEDMSMRIRHLPAEVGIQ